MTRPAGVLWVALCATPAPAQEAAPPAAAPSRPSDEVYAGVAAEDLLPGGTGAALSAGWLHRFSGGFSTDVALASERVEETRSTYGRLSGFGWLTRRVHLRGGVSLGASEREAAEGLRYRRLVGGLGVMLVPGRLLAEIESQYLDIADVEGHVLRPQLSAFVPPSLSLNAAYFVSTSSGLDVSALSLRVDLQRDGWSPFAGALFGRVTAAALDSLPGITAPLTSQAYAGLRAPVGRHELTLVADRSRAGQVTRLRLSVLWRTPL